MVSLHIPLQKKSPAGFRKTDSNRTLEAKYKITDFKDFEPL